MFNGSETTQDSKHEPAINAFQQLLDSACYGIHAKWNWNGFLWEERLSCRRNEQVSALTIDTDLRSR
jgi:hypothetical protein